MKVECIKDEYEGGLIFKKTKKFDGITAGRVYDATLFSHAEGQYTDTTPEFFIYNDNNEWCRYDVDNFKPAKKQNEQD